MAVRSFLRSLTIPQRFILALVVLAALSVVVRLAVGADNISGSFTNFLVVLLLFFLSRLRLWRVRNRLLVSYFLFGVVPFFFVIALTTTALTTLFGLIAADRIRTALDDRARNAGSLAREIATVASFQREAEVAMLSRLITGFHPRGRAIVKIDGMVRAIPDGSGAPFENIPAWNSPDFSGLIESGDRYFIGASAHGNEPSIDVLVYTPLDAMELKTVKGVAAPALMPLTADADINMSIQALRSFVTVVDLGKRTRVEYSPETGLPPRGGIWDSTIGWSVKRAARQASGGTRDVLITFVSRPSLLMTALADPSDLGPRLLLIVATVLGAIFFVASAGSVFWSARLTRSITRAVHDLYEGTRQVAAGNLAHRTPVRGTDQLSELASSFNGMTERVQQLIVEVGEKKKLESELEIARQVQLQQFPKSVPKLKTLEVAAQCIPSRFVSGDYYDYLLLTSGRMALALGDVSGKGISAALVMASLQSALHAQLRHAPANGQTAENLSTASVMRRLSEQLYENTPAEKYATFFCALYDDRTGSLLYTNAGHLPPILLRGSESIRLDVGGTVVGLMPLFAYDQQVIELQPGDLLAMFTDGITEAEDASGEQFGDERLTSLLTQHKDQPLEEIVRIVTDRVREWAHDPDSADDTTILLARRIQA
jgi:sigma-B regulation protein RsbU (phosphoserine phosphatase)